jgi:hypothetical protein
MDTINTSPNAETKFCINCRHIGTNASGDYTKYRCFAPQNFSHLNLVSGLKEYVLQSCVSARSTETFAGTAVCGPEGKWFEQRPPQVIDHDQALAEIRATRTKLRAGTDLLKDLGL